MAVPNNILEAVQTIQMAQLGYLQNSFAFIAKSNKRFKDFQNFKGNLGSSVQFRLPFRSNTKNSLVASFQGLEERVQTLTVDQQISNSFAFTSEELLFNVHAFMDEVGKDAVAEVGSKIEANVALNCKTGPYRFYGDGVTPINSFGQLANAVKLFTNFGVAKNSSIEGFISDIAVPAICNSGLNQFALDRNNEMANSWELGKFSKCEWYESNLLPVHTAGSEGINGSTLTVVSVTKDSDDAVTSITFSGCNAASDADSVKQYDRFRFNDGVAGQPNMRFRTFVGHEISASPVQFMASADAASTAGSQVTVSITPGLKASSGKNQNINNQIVAGMQCSVLPSHRVGLISAGNPLMLAMPQLPQQPPFDVANKVDPDTGCSLRSSYGSKFAENEQGMVLDAIWGSTFIREYGMALIFPL